MPSEPQNDKPAATTGDNAGETDWLLQFYTPSKTTVQTEFPETADSAPTAESPAAQLSTLPGEKYAVGEELGAGAMKRVRRTLDKNAERDVALAVLIDDAARPKKVSRFVREARITAALEHPNIVPIYDIGVDEAGKPYFTMKLLGGETLHTILQRLKEGNADYRKRHPLNRLLQIFLSVCNAVSFAHSRGVVDLDLKPANIQGGDFGEVLVLDWGLAKVLQKDPAQFPHRLVLGEGLREIPKEGVVRGTPGFMGPEQARGEYASLNEQTDIFALGAVLYTILKCKPPSKPNKTSSGRQSNKGEKSTAFKISPALEAVAAKAMARQPVSRYQAVGELAGDVQAFLDGYATKAQQAGALTLLWLLIKRHPVVTTLMVTSVTLVFAVLAIALDRMHKSKVVVEQALNDLKADKENQQKLSLLAAPHVMAQAEHFIHVMDYDQAVSTLEYEVTLDSKNGAAWEALGALCLGRQEFEQAILAFSHLPQPPPAVGKNGELLMIDLPAVASKFAPIARAYGGTLPRNLQHEFASAIYNADRAAPPHRIMALGAFFKNQNRSVETANFDLIEQMLREMNPESKNLEFFYLFTDDGLKISLHGSHLNGSGNPLQNAQLLPLIGLPVACLDLSNSPDIPPEALDWLRDLPLTTLDLSGDRISGLQPLGRIPTLTELRLVNTRDKDYPMVRSMTQLKRIVVSDSEEPEARKALQSHASNPPEIIGE
jgi:hypothetical protein